MGNSNQNTLQAQASTIPVFFDYYRYILAPLVFAFIILSFLTMRVINDLRVNEVGFNLRQSNRTGAASSSTLLARYKLMSKDAGSSADYLAEGRLMAVMSKLQQVPDYKVSYPWLEPVAVSVINLMALATGTDPYRISTGIKKERLLQAAYIYERKRMFEQAADVYKKVLAGYSLAASEEGYIKLHLGFCLALLSDTSDAVKHLEWVTLKLPESEMAVTAFLLIQYITEFDRRLRKIEQMPESVEKGESFYEIMAYTRAIETMSKLKAPETLQQSQSLYFYRGRSYEETGDVAKAVADYTRVIDLKADSDLGIAANRRLYMLSTFYEKNDDLKKKALANGLETGDAGFFVKAEKYEKSVTLEAEQQFLKDSNNLTLLKNETGVDTVPIADSYSNIEIESENTESIAILRQKLKKVKQKQDIIEQIRKEKARPLNLEKYTKAQPEERVTIIKKNEKQVYRIKTRTMGTIIGHIRKRTSSQVQVLSLYGELNIPASEILSEEKIESDLITRE